IAVARYTAQTLAAHGHFALGRQVVLVETPRDELRQGVFHGLRRIGTGERAHQRDAHGIAVDLIVTGVSPAHVLFDDGAGLLDATCASFKNLTVLVDEEVVADIAPATAVHVIGLRGLHDAAGLRFGIRVAARRVVHHGALQFGAYRAGAITFGLGSPTTALNDLRLGHTGRGGFQFRRLARVNGHQLQTLGFGLAFREHAHLGGIRRADPTRLGTGPSVLHRLRIHMQISPVGPLAVGAPAYFHQSLASVLRQARVPCDSQHGELLEIRLGKLRDDVPAFQLGRPALAALLTFLGRFTIRHRFTRLDVELPG